VEPGLTGQFCAPENLTAVTRLINDIINEDVTYEAKPLQLRNQRVYAVKVGNFSLEDIRLTLQAGVNGLLDVARQTYKEANHDAYQLMLDLQRK
jgi:DNA mismatch repair protein MSH4